MSNPVSMMLGAFPFQAMGLSYDGVQRKVDTQWADIAVAQGLNQQQWSGPTSETVTIKGVLFPAEWPASLSGLIDAANSGASMYLVSGDAASGTIHGTFTVQSIDEDRGYIDGAGRAWRNAYTLTLKRYGGAAAGGSSIGSALASLVGGLW